MKEEVIMLSECMWSIGDSRTRWRWYPTGLPATRAGRWSAPVLITG